jgi:hypothetical protein
MSKFWKLFVWPGVFVLLLLGYLDWRNRASVDRLSKDPGISVDSSNKTKPSAQDE